MKSVVSFIFSVLLHFGLLYLVYSIVLPIKEIEISLAEPIVNTGNEKPGTPDSGKFLLKDGDGQTSCPKSYGGIGIESGLRGPHLYETVSIVAPGYPAEKAGIKVGDVLYYQGQLRGEIGSTVNIKVLRDGIHVLEFSIIREKICYN